MSNYSKEVNDLLNEASKLYASKNYDIASAKYGEACELYSNENEGKENIELLFLYGKALFQSGVSKSEAFGAGEGQVQGNNSAEEEEDNEDAAQDSGNFQFNETLAEEEEEEEEEDGGKLEVEEESEDHEVNPEGESKAELSGGDAKEEEEEEEEEQTDFELAWDILDLTRTLIEAELSTIEDQKPEGTPFVKTDSNKGEPVSSNQYVNYLGKLAETYDLLGEVSLEAENFPQAAVDLAKSLEMRQQLFPPTSQSISESHYKLSLALEFCVEDPDSRSKAAEQMKLALDIVKAQPEKDTELIKDLEVRLIDLNKDPAEELQAEKERILKGILGEKIDDEPQTSSASTAAFATASTAPVNDLTNMIVKKKRKSDNKKVLGQKKQKQ